MNIELLSVKHAIGLTTKLVLAAIPFQYSVTREGLNCIVVEPKHLYTKQKGVAEYLLDELRQSVAVTLCTRQR